MIKNLHKAKMISISPLEMTVKNKQNQTKKQNITIQYNTIQYNTIQYNTIQDRTKQYRTPQKYNTIQYNAILYKTRQNKTKQNNTKQNKGLRIYVQSSYLFYKVGLDFVYRNCRFYYLYHLRVGVLLYYQSDIFSFDAWVRKDGL